MDNLTVVIPYYQERAALDRLLATLPSELPVIVVDDLSDTALYLNRAQGAPDTTVCRPLYKSYFTGAVNIGIENCHTDVLVLNQDITLTGTAWLDLLAEKRAEYALIGERIKGDHPAFPHGYVHGVFQFMRRDAIEAAGLMDAKHYPLWGASALWQWQIVRKGFKSLPLAEIPGLWHEPRKPGERFGSSITQLLKKEPTNQPLFIRTPPAVSVVIPCFNHGRFLADAVNSLIGGKTSLGVMPGQTFQSFEVLIVDDGSTDNTPVIAKSLVNDWNGVRYVRRANGGTAAANNLGVKLALGQYICIMAADDMREPWSLADLYAAQLEHPNEFVYDELTVFTNGKRGDRWTLPAYDCALLSQRNMVHAGIMFPRDAWKEAGGYPERMIHGREDWAFNVALAMHGWYGHKIERSGYLYRREGHNRSLANGAWREHFKVQMAQLYPALYKNGGDMACCGGSKSAPPTNGNARMGRAIMATDVPEGMVLIEYLGGNVGSEMFGGPGTVKSNRYYVFGKNEKDRIKYVDGRDLDWFLKLRENEKALFKRHVVAEPVKQAEPEKQPEPASVPPWASQPPIVAQELQQEHPLRKQRKTRPEA